MKKAQNFQKNARSELSTHLHMVRRKAPVVHAQEGLLVPMGIWKFSNAKKDIIVQVAIKQLHKLRLYALKIIIVRVTRQIRFHVRSENIKFNKALGLARNAKLDFIVDVKATVRSNVKSALRNSTAPRVVTCQKNVLQVLTSLPDRLDFRHQQTARYVQLDNTVEMGKDGEPV